MANININTNEVRRQARLLKEASTQLINGTVKPMEEVNQSIQSIWTGETARLFLKYADELKTNLKSNAQDINEISVFLTEACQAIERAEREAKAKIK